MQKLWRVKYGFKVTNFNLTEENSRPLQKKKKGSTSPTTREHENVINNCKTTVYDAIQALTDRLWNAFYVC